MPFRYNNPSNVLSPRNKIKNVQVLFDGGNKHGSYSVAKLKWNNNDVIGVRWNISENEAYNEDKKSGRKVSLGEPNSRGYSTWFILPDDLLSRLVKGGDLNEKLKDYLKER